MRWLTTILDVAAGCVGAAGMYLGAQRWLHKSAKYDFEPELNIARKDGWALLDLALTNHSKTPIWAEQAIFALADLDADFQSCSPAKQTTLKIRETVRPGQTLRISMIETVYTAAGKPQGEYSFLISGTVAYQAGNNRFEIGLQTYRVRMIALSAIRLLQMRWYDQPSTQSGARARLRRLSGDDKDWETH